MSQENVESVWHVYEAWTIENAKALELRIYSDRGKALEAAGLSKQDAHADS